MREQFMPSIAGDDGACCGAAMPLLFGNGSAEMEKLGANSRPVRSGSETSRLMDRRDSEPGLLRGPVSWGQDACTVSSFSRTICAEFLESESTLASELVARARAGRSEERRVGK